MKKIVMILFVGLFAMANSTMAQEDRERRGGKVLELKKAFLQEKLELSDGEMAKFWPIHEGYIQERRAIKKSMKGIRDDVKESENLSEAEFGSKVDELSDLRMDEIKNDKVYAKSAVSVIGVNKFKKLKALEREFKSELRQKREGRNGEGGRHGRKPPPPEREGDRH